MEETNKLNDKENSNVPVPDGAEVTVDEIRKAKELLRANGYALIGYRDAGKKVKRALASGLDFVKRKWNGLGEWISAKRNEMKARQEAAAEKRRLAEEAEKKRLAEEAQEKRIADGDAVRRTEAESGEAAKCSPAPDSGYALPKCSACGAELVLGARFCRKCGKPVSAGGDAPSLESPVEAETENAAVAESNAVVVENAVPVDSAGPNTLKCAACGAALAAGMKFCGECGTPVHAETHKPRQRKTARPRKSSLSVAEK